MRSVSLQLVDSPSASLWVVWIGGWRLSRVGFQFTLYKHPGLISSNHQSRIQTTTKNNLTLGVAESGAKTY